MAKINVTTGKGNSSPHGDVAATTASVTVTAYTVSGEQSSISILLSE